LTAGNESLVPDTVKQQRAGFRQPFAVFCGLWKHAEQIPRVKAKFLIRTIKGSEAAAAT
jgi:hypothetical protein